MIAASVLLNSVAPSGRRLITMRVTMPRFILAEFNTHRVFSRNAGSSRAISVRRRIDAVTERPMIPVEWGLEEPGMQATGVLSPEAAATAEMVWRSAARSAAWAASELAELGVHKQVVNRLLEPFSWVDVVVTATEWKNFFLLRQHFDSQPEMRAVADAMAAATQASELVEVPWGGWHLPGITDEDRGEIPTHEDLCYVAAGRLARTSYGRAERPWQSDRELALRLVKSGHWSPFEHIAVARPGRSDDCRNFLRDWVQWRAKLD